MLLPKQVRIEIAEQLIRIVYPVLLIAILTASLTIILFTPGQYLRFVNVAAVIVIMIPTGILYLKGKPLPSASFVIVGMCAAFLTGMYLNGGVRAPIYVGFITVVTLVVCLYGTIKAIVFAIIVMVIGAGYLLMDYQQLLPSAAPPSSAFYYAIMLMWLFIALFFSALPVNLLQKSLIGKGLAERELKSILNKTPDIIYRLDAEGRITFISDVIRNYGYEPKSLIGKPIMGLVHPDDQLAAQRRIIERRAGERGAEDTEVRLSMRKAASNATRSQVSDVIWIPFHISSCGLYADDTSSPESFIGIQGIARDISKTRHFEQQADQLAAAVEQAAEDVVITDKKGVIQYVNPSFKAVTGYSKAEVIGNTPRIFKSGKQDKSFYEILWNTISSGKV